MPTRTGFFIKTVFLLTMAFVIGTVSILYLLYVGDDSAETVELIIPRKATVTQVAGRLAEERIIFHPTFFRYLLRFSGGEHKVRAGEFRFKRGMRLMDALFVLYHEDPIVHPVTIPEGWNTRQIAEILANAGLIDTRKFVDLALGHDMAKRFQINAPNVEGFLYPDTYAFSRVDGEERIIETMVQMFFKRFDKNLRQQALQMGFTLEQFVTLASIVEKETGSAGERELVSSVFHNRLKKKMRLQSDPTTIYGIPGFNGNLTRADLLRYSPYNTYVIAGLPPGPITNPGLAALQATLHPADTDFLYFVANNQGSHLFSATYGQHSRNVDEYQKSRKRKSSDYGKRAAK